MVQCERVVVLNNLNNRLSKTVDNEKSHGIIWDKEMVLNNRD